MRKYGAYMDRAVLSPAAHRRLMAALEGGEKGRGRGRMAHYGILAAGLLLVCTLVGLVVPKVGGDTSPQLSHDAPPGTKDTYGPGEMPPRELTPIRFEEGPEQDYSIALSDRWFKETLSRGQMDILLGGASMAEKLGWGGYDLTGQVIYDDNGAVGQVMIDGVSRAEERHSFHLTLKPGALPEECGIVEGAPATEVNGVPVTGHRGQYGWDDSGVLGESRTVRFMAGDVGVEFAVNCLDGASAEHLATVLANTYAGLGQEVSLDQLIPAEIPAWSRRDVSLQEARAVPEMGAYIPAQVPDGLSFEHGRIERGERFDTLYLRWGGGYRELSITVSTLDKGMAPMDAHLLTAEWVREELAYVDNDAGDTPGYRGQFAVYHPEKTKAFPAGIMVQYRIKGPSPDEVCAMLGIS